MDWNSYWIGAQFGTVITLPLSGILCEHGFDGGWPTVFYVFGTLGVVWFAIWMPLTADSPSRHRKISKVEKDYICSSLKDSIKRVIYPQHPFQQLANFFLFYRKLHQCRGVVCLDQKHVGLLGQLMLAMPGDFTHYLLNCQVIWITYFISIWNRCLKVVPFPTRLCVDIYIFCDAEFVRVCSSVPGNVALLSSVQYYCWPTYCQSNF